MAKHGGWAGKVLHVDLSTGRTWTEDTIEKYKDYLGGTGIGYRIMWDEVPAGTKPYDSANRITLAAFGYSHHRINSHRHPMRWIAGFVRSATMIGILDDLSADNTCILQMSTKLMTTSGSVSRMACRMVSRLSR